MTVNNENFALQVATVSNSFGGSEKETEESIRTTAPFQYATQNRAVTAEDYATLVQRNFGSLLNDISSFGGEDALGCAGSLYTPCDMPSKNENCQK